MTNTTNKTASNSSSKSTDNDTNNAFGDGFVYRSPLSSQSHDPPLCLASNCVRDFFGPIVQTVFDAIMKIGGTTTLSQLTSTIRKECTRTMNEERERIIVRGKYKLQRAKGPAQHGYIVDANSIRAGLLVLVQHDIVTVSTSSQWSMSSSKGKSSNNTNRLYYTAIPHKARLMIRYPKWIEYVKKVMDETAATLVETLLLEGKISTVNAIYKTVENLPGNNEDDDEDDEDEEDENNNNNNDSKAYAQRQSVAETFHRLVEGNFVVKVPHLTEEEQEEEEEDPDEGEVEWTEEEEKEAEGREEDAIMADNPTSNDGIVKLEQIEEDQDHSSPKKKKSFKKKKKKKVQFLMEEEENENERDEKIVSILSNAPYKTSLPKNEIWRLNWALIQSSLKSFSLGRLVAERYGHRVASAGSIVTAALKYQSYSTTTTGPDAGVFTPNDLSNFLPKAVQQSLETKSGGLLRNLSRSLVELCKLDYPVVVDEVEEAHGHAHGGRFSICTTKLVKHLRDRTIHQFLFHAYGDLAARIVSVLRVQGGCEAEHLAEAAMVPAKDTREILHRMYQDNLVQLLTLQQGRAHNPSTMIFIWTVDHTHLLRTVRDKVCTAMTNLRLRRQHESEYVGKAWMERALQAGDVDENEIEEDKIRYNKFSQGLERLDHAVMQLDETLMVLWDF